MKMFSQATPPDGSLAYSRQDAICRRRLKTEQFRHQGESYTPCNRSLFKRRNRPVLKRRRHNRSASHTGLRPLRRDTGLFSCVGPATHGTSDDDPARGRAHGALLLALPASTATTPGRMAAVTTVAPVGEAARRLSHPAGTQRPGPSAGGHTCVSDRLGLECGLQNRPPPGPTYVHGHPARSTRRPTNSMAWRIPKPSRSARGVSFPTLRSEKTRRTTSTTTRPGKRRLTQEWCVMGDRIASGTLQDTPRIPQRRGSLHYAGDAARATRSDLRHRSARGAALPVTQSPPRSWLAQHRRE
jgi:hypothetical protein